jgi:hypothetical protein
LHFIVILLGYTVVHTSPAEAGGTENAKTALFPEGNRAVLKREKRAAQMRGRVI